MVGYRAVSQETGRYLSPAALLLPLRAAPTSQSPGVSPALSLRLLDANLTVAERKPKKALQQISYRTGDSPGFYFLKSK